jgi:hypothetical protein
MTDKPGEVRGRAHLPEWSADGIRPRHGVQNSLTSSGCQSWEANCPKPDWGLEQTGAVRYAVPSTRSKRIPPHLLLSAPADQEV